MIVPAYKNGKGAFVLESTESTSDVDSYFGSDGLLHVTNLTGFTNRNYPAHLLPNQYQGKKRVIIGIRHEFPVPNVKTYLYIMTINGWYRVEDFQPATNEEISSILYSIEYVVGRGQIATRIIDQIGSSSNIDVYPNYVAGGAIEIETIGIVNNSESSIISDRTIFHPIDGNSAKINLINNKVNEVEEGLSSEITEVMQRVLSVEGTTTSNFVSR